MKPKSRRTLTPKLRFPEFRDEGEWGEKKLGEIVALEYGSPLPEKDRKVGCIPVIGSNGIVGYHDEAIVDGPAIVVGRKGSAGQVNWIESDCYPIDTTFFVKNLVSDSYPIAFIWRLLERSYLEELGDAGAVPGLNRNEVYLMKTCIPTPPEQQKIADCLGSLDALIAAEGRKLAAIRDHKHGLMQQLFPQPGQTQPRLRFPEFRDEGEWGEEKLSQHITLVSGNHLSPTEYSDRGEVPYFTGPSDFTNSESDVSKWTTRTDNKGVAGDVLITVKGSGVGELWYLELSQAALGRQLMAVRPSNGVSRFYFQLLLSMRGLFEDLAMGNLIPGLSRGDILNLKTLLPKEEEQQKIADCLSSLDAHITTQVAKIEALKQHKRGLMQQLFPAPEEGV